MCISSISLYPSIFFMPVMRTGPKLLSDARAQIPPSFLSQPYVYAIIDSDMGRLPHQSQLSSRSNMFVCMTTVSATVVEAQTGLLGIRINL